MQHRTYVTSYLRRQILDRGLDKPIGLGRIYRIVPDKTKPAPRTTLSDMGEAELVKALGSQNGWTRDTAQRLLVEQRSESSIELLRSLAVTNGKPLAQIHALWTLEGLGGITEETLGAIARDPNNTPKVLATAARFATSPETLKHLATNPSAEVQLALAFQLGTVPGDAALGLLADVVTGSSKDSLIADAALSGLADREAEFLAVIEGRENAPKKLVANLAKSAALSNSGPANETKLKGDALAAFHRGKAVYATTCFACHGADGEGVKPLAPPLVRSEWVTGSPQRLAHIILNGLQGPITVAGKKYAPPEIQPIMPGLGLTPEFDDAKIADVMTYVRNAWGNEAKPVTPSEIAAARKSAKQGIYTPEELSD